MVNISFNTPRVITNGCILRSLGPLIPTLASMARHPLGHIILLSIHLILPPFLPHTTPLLATILDRCHLTRDTLCSIHKGLTLATQRGNLTLPTDPMNVTT
jgi:hypothetical protein